MQKVLPALGLDDSFIPSLQQILAHVIGLYLQSHKFHFDVTGPHFGELHELYQDHYEYFFGLIDDVGERIRQLGGFPEMSLQSLLNRNEVPLSDTPLSADSQVEAQFAALSMFARDLRNFLTEINKTQDFATVNWLSDVIQRVEKEAWKVRAILEGMEKED